MKLYFEDLGMNVPKYCRKIMKTEGYPKTLEIYRGDMLCLTVDVEGAAKLRLVENETIGPVYKKFTDNGFLKAHAACTVATTGEFK